MNDMEQSAGIQNVSKRIDLGEQVLNVESLKDDIDVKRVFAVLWEGRRVIFFVTVLSAVISLMVSLCLSRQYRATAVLMPATNSGASSLSRLASQFGGIATLAGLNLGATNDSDKITAAIELIKTWGFQSKFIRDNHIEAAVFAAHGWDRVRNELVYDDGIYDALTKRWVRKFNPSKGETAEPTSGELYEVFSKRISISQNSKTGLISFSVEYYSPYIAKDWVEKLVAAANKYMQERDRAEASSSIKYLQEKLAQTNLAEMRTVFAQLIEEQTKTLMLADVSDEYVFKVLSPTQVPEEESKPKKVLICIVGTLVGAVFSMLGVLFRRSFA